MKHGDQMREWMTRTTANTSNSTRAALRQPPAAARARPSSSGQGTGSHAKRLAAAAYLALASFGAVPIDFFRLLKHREAL